MAQKVLSTTSTWAMCILPDGSKPSYAIGLGFLSRRFRSSVGSMHSSATLRASSTFSSRVSLQAVPAHFDTCQKPGTTGNGTSPPITKHCTIRDALSIRDPELAQPLYCSFHAACGGMTLPHFALSGFCFVHVRLSMENLSFLAKHWRTGSHWQVPQVICPQYWQRWAAQKESRRTVEKWTDLTQPDVRDTRH